MTMLAHKKKLGMRMRIFVSGLVCLMMTGVLVAAAFPSGIHLTRIYQGKPAGQVIVDTANARPRS